MTDRRLIVGAVGVSALGDFLLWIPLTLHVHEQTGSGAAVAALMICLWGPIVLLAPVAGRLADRVETRRLLLWSSLAQAVIAAGLALALDSTAATLALAALLGAGFAVSQPAEFALVPVIGSNLNGPVEAARYAGMTAGPVLGAALAAAGGTEAAVLVDAASFALVALAAALLRARREPHPEEPGERARDGVVLLFRDRALAVVMATVLGSLLFMSASIAAEVVFIQQDLGVNGVAYGVIFSSWTVGMVVGALVVSRRVRAGALAGAALVAVGVQGAGLGLPTVWLAAGFGAVMFFAGGVGHGVKNVLTRSLIQERVPGRFHGRAFAAYNGLRNGAELVALAWGGLLIVAIGARGTLALAGAISVLAALAGLLIHAGSARAPGRRPAGLPHVPDAGSPAAQRSAG
jgi:Na+/melibiose symporter-like transporter